MDTYQEKLERLKRMAAASATRSGYTGAERLNVPIQSREMSAQSIYDTSMRDLGFAYDPNESRGLDLGSRGYAMASGPGIAANTTPYVMPTGQNPLESLTTRYGGGSQPSPEAIAAAESMGITRGVQPTPVTPEERMRQAQIKEASARFQPQMTKQERSVGVKSATEEYREAVAAIQATEDQKAEIARQEAEAKRKDQLEADKREAENQRKMMEEAGATLRTRMTTQAQRDVAEQQGKTSLDVAEMNRKSAENVAIIQAESGERKSAEATETALIETRVAGNRSTAKELTKILKADAKNAKDMISQYVDPNKADAIGLFFEANPALYEGFRRAVIEKISEKQDITPSDIQEIMVTLVDKTL